MNKVDGKLYILDWGAYKKHYSDNVKIGVWLFDTEKCYSVKSVDIEKKTVHIKQDDCQCLSVPLEYFDIVDLT